MDSELLFYFPAPLLMQYVDATSVQELHDFAEGDPVKFYISFVRNSDPDYRTSILIPPNLKERFLEYRNALYGLILGRDVKLFFSKDAPEVPDWNPSDLEYYLSPSLIEDVRSLKLRKYRVIERIIVTDMLFRVYYEIRPLIESELKDYRKLRRELKNMTIHKSARFASVWYQYVPYDRVSGSVTVNIWYPEQLAGFKHSCLPLLSWSGVVQLGMLHFFVSGRWSEVDDVVSSLKIGGITDPSDEFLDDCEYHWRRSVESYTARLRRFVRDARAILEDKDPVEEFILSSLPATFFEIYEAARECGFDLDEVMARLKLMIRRGVIKTEGELLKV